MKDLKALGMELKAARVKKDWTLPQMAEKIGMDPKTYARYEKGTQPALQKLFKAAQLLGIKIDVK